MDADIANLAERLRLLEAENVSLRQRVDDLTAPAADGGRSDGRLLLKPQKPTPYDPSAKDANVRTWLFAINNFFTAMRIPDDGDATKIDYAVTLLQGPALEWWRQMTVMTGRESVATGTVNPARALFRTPVGEQTRARMAALQQRPTTWTQFTEALLARFDLVNVGVVARNRLKRLRQLTSVQEYTRRFLALCAEIDDLSEAERVDRYRDGLKVEIQEVLALQGIEDFPTMIAAAERIDALRFEHRRDRGFQNVEVRAMEATRPQRDMTKVKCYNCDQMGHFARDCRKPKKKQWNPKRTTVNRVDVDDQDDSGNGSDQQ